MPVRKDDEIMAEYLLKGGKMLEKSCKTCGCPLFEVRGKTLCVVCAEKDTAERSNPATAAPALHEQDSLCTSGEHHEESCRGGLLTDKLATVIDSLSERIHNEKEPDNVLVLMNAVKAGAEALEILRRL